MSGEMPDAARITHLQAHYQGMAVLIASTTMALLWSFLRLPHGDTMFVVATALPASLVHAAPDFPKRVKIMFNIILWGGALQFLIAMLIQQKVLVLICPAILAMLMLLYFPNASAAAVAVTIGYLAIDAPGGLLAGTARFFALWISFGVILFSIVLVKLCEPPELGCPVAPPPQMSFSRALRIVVAISLAFWFYRFFRIPQGSWMVLVICLLYVADSPRTVLRHLAIGRVLGTPLGLYVAFLYLSLLTYFDYRFIYLLTIFAALAFYIYYRWNNYFMFSALFMMTLAIASDFIAGTNLRVNLWDIYFCRVVNTALGGLLVIFMDRYFLPGEMKERQGAYIEV